MTPGRALGRGIFLVFEGVEGAGKSTQAKLLADWLAASEIPYLLTREPGGTRLGEEIRRLLLSEPEDVPVRSELLLMLAARAALIAEVVEPALARGQVVVGDRYELSTLAYQGYGRQLELAQVRQINTFATGGLRPDVTLFLDVPVAEGEARYASARAGADRIELAGRAFHERVGEAYRLLASSEPGMQRLDGTAPAAEVHAAVLQLLRAQFPETFARALG